MSEQHENQDSKGLRAKYRVLKDGEPQDGCFVLKPESDPAARKALEAYAVRTDDQELSIDLLSWLADIKRENADA